MNYLYTVFCRPFTMKYYLFGSSSDGKYILWGMRYFLLGVAMWGKKKIHEGDRFYGMCIYL